MFVRMWMTTKVVTVPPETPIMAAHGLMQKHRIRRLPVVDSQGELAGIISKGDIQGAGPSDTKDLSIWELNHALSRIRVEEVMTKADDLITVAPDAPIEQAALLMRKHKVGGLPVLQNEKLIGIITESDVFEVLIEVLGIRKGGTRMTLELEDRPGALSEALDVVREHEANVLSVVTCERCKTKTGYATVVIRVDAYDWRKIVKDLKDQKIRVLDVLNVQAMKDRE
jgi:acetoin utilization protein AcuB